MIQRLYTINVVGHCLVRISARVIVHMTKSMLTYVYVLFCANFSKCM